MPRSEWFATSRRELTGAFVHGEHRFTRSQRAIALRSYVYPSAHTTGSRMQRMVMGHLNSFGTEGGREAGPAPAHRGRCALKVPVPSAFSAMRVDPALMGGLIVRIGSRLFDTSVKTKLNRLEAAMKGVA